MNTIMKDEGDIEETDEQVILEEYKIWKKNSPFMYDTMITHVLEWPSLTVEWASTRECSPNSDYSFQTLLLGTNTGNTEQELLLQAKVKIPMEQSLISGKIYLDNTKDAGGIGLLSKTDNKIEITAKINHEKEVLRARAMPKQDYLIATKSPNSFVYIYDLRKYSNKSAVSPNLVLTGHNKEGKGLAWFTSKQGMLASAAHDNIINIWDISQGNTLPLRTYFGHENGIEDLVINENGVLASVGNDKKIMLWDHRQELPTHVIEAHSREITSADFNNAIMLWDHRQELPTHIIEAHSREITSADFNNASPYILATGSKDKTIGIWDLRNLSLKSASFSCHKDIVTSVKWAPYTGNLVASASNDRRVMIWDLTNIGKVQSEEEAEDGPPELVFIHGGHTSYVSDIAWNPNEDLTLASVAEDNILQVWQVSNSIFNY
ncbi:hypothetical protein SteCoe_31213 [Stentor coeruleus]|uniref:Histone-binding protein RBBP4-like N-terminal domain-containing protein n=1 Tax=Stentor coeruleus TaxID=5963 RepID=A0A1R2B1W3_9CILI|nr:hypothetical protein SteCoe_31213 [Stentor coeruleus]